MFLYCSFHSKAGHIIIIYLFIVYLAFPCEYSGPRPIYGPEDHSLQRSRKTIYNFFVIFEDQLGPTLSVCVQLV
jgi:hypothetical protein